MRERGSGSLFRERYRDKQTGQLKVCRTWMMKLWVGGKPLKRSARTTSRTMASKQLEQWKAQIRQGTYVPDADQTRFDDLATLLTDEYRANGRKSLGRAEAAIAHLKEFFTGWRAQAISTDRILAYVRHRQQQHAANATINRELAALKRMFRLGERAGRIVRRPFIDLLQEHNARTGFFERAECDAVLAQLPDDLQAVFAVASLTGWRVKSELLTRQWAHVDFQSGWLRLEPGETKNAEGRQFPLTPALRAVLERQRARTLAIEKATRTIIPWLFHRSGRPIKSFRRAWVTACTATGLSGRIPHDFRRTAVRNLERAGVPRSTAMKMVGHKTESIYRRYAIVDEAMLKEGAAKLQTLHEAQAPAAPVIPLIQATRTTRVSSSTVRVSRAQRARRVRVARAKSLPAGEKRMVGWDGIEPPTPGFSVLCRARSRRSAVLRDAGLVDALSPCTDYGDVPLLPPRSHRDAATGIIDPAGLAAMVTGVRSAVGRILADGCLPVVIGGDCPLLLGCLAGARDRHGRLGLLFVDGHEDAYPPVLSPTGQAADMELGFARGLSMSGTPELDATAP